jgi:hypothetical protein
MLPAFRDSFRAWVQRFGDGWNRFWFASGDPISLAVIRISTGLVALYLHLTFTFDLIQFFGADGLLPPHVVNQWAVETIGVPGFPTLPRLSYLSYVTNPTALWVLHALAFVPLIAFTIGLFTRYAGIASLIVVLSYMHRAPMLVSQVEPLVAMLLFYLCLGPCGAVLSLDAKLRPRHLSLVTRHSSLALRLIQIHFAAFCFLMGLSKLAGGNSNVWWSGEAIWMLISRPESRLVDLTWLGHPFLIDVWTHAVVWFELLFPILIWNRWARPLMLALAVPIWGSLLLVTGLTLFYLTLICASLAFIPAPWWRDLLSRLSRSRECEQPAEQPAEEPCSPREQVEREPAKPRRRKSGTVTR